MTSVHDHTAVSIPVSDLVLRGDLRVPEGAEGLVLFAHGSGSSRLSPRNRYVAEILHEHSLGTLLADLLTTNEEREDQVTAHLRFDIGLLTERLLAITEWLRAQLRAQAQAIGYFGASTGAAAALIAAARRPDLVKAVVSRGGRPDLAGSALAGVQVPTLLIVGGADTTVLRLNEQARARMTAKTDLRIVPGATHLFEEPGALAVVARMAAAWFRTYLIGSAG
jgi:dienelactone hydrolase